METPTITQLEADQLELVIKRVVAIYPSAMCKSGKCLKQPFYITDSYQVLGVGETIWQAWTAVDDDLAAKVRQYQEVGR